MSKTEVIQFFSSLGVGGVLAAGMFWVYRKDSLAAQQRIEDLMLGVLTLATKLADITGEVSAHTALLQRLFDRLDISEDER